jgi:hypothetical protein
VIVGLSPLERYRFDVAGFLLFDDVIDASEVSALRRAIEDHGIDRLGTGVMDQRFGWESDLLGCHQAFRDLLDHPRVLKLLTDLIGPSTRLDHVYGFADCGRRRRDRGVLGGQGRGWRRPRADAT